MQDKEKYREKIKRRRDENLKSFCGLFGVSFRRELIVSPTRISILLIKRIFCL